MTAYTSGITCGHCGEPILQRSDLLVVIKDRTDLMPLHESCQKEISDRSVWKGLPLHPVNRGDDYPQPKGLWKWLWGAFLLMLGVNIAVFLIWGEIYLSPIVTMLLPVVPIVRYFLYLHPGYLIGNFFARKGHDMVMDHYRKKSWELYESKLPE